MSCALFSEVNREYLCQHLFDTHQYDIVALQEVDQPQSSWAAKVEWFSSRGHCLIILPGAKAMAKRFGFMVHKRWVDFVHILKPNLHAVAIDLKLVGFRPRFVSVHLPRVGDLADYSSVLAEVASYSPRSICSPLFVGGDCNAVLGED